MAIQRSGSQHFTHIRITPRAYCTKTSLGGSGSESGSDSRGSRAAASLNEERKTFEINVGVRLLEIHSLDAPSGRPARRERFQPERYRVGTHGGTDPAHEGICRGRTVGGGVVHVPIPRRSNPILSDCNAVTLVLLRVTT